MRSGLDDAGARTHTDWPEAWHLSARRSVRALGRLTERIPPPVRRALYWLSVAGETWVFLPIGALALDLSDVLLGPIVSVALVLCIWLAARRPSVKAIAWLCGGVYLGIQVVVAANVVAASAAAGSADIGSLVEMTAWALTMLGLGIIVLTVLVPIGRFLRSCFPGLTRYLTMWLSEVAAGGLGGAVIGATLAMPIGASSSGIDAHATGSFWLPLIGGVIGVVVGGLRADHRLRLTRLPEQQ
jgi:hypothetical protein